jgi:hypothetical protein
MDEHGTPPDRPSPEHRRPPGTSDAAVAAAGRLSEALETVERARGHLYAFHQLTGRADGGLDAAVAALREAGEDALAGRVEEELIGRNVVAGRWTFQLVEEYDDGYCRVFRSLEEEARERLTGGRRHLHEAEMKERRRTPGRPGHRAAPDPSGGRDA